MEHIEYKRDVYIYLVLTIKFIQFDKTVNNIALSEFVLILMKCFNFQLNHTSL